jgi:hypothetical protein
MNYLVTLNNKSMGLFPFRSEAEKIIEVFQRASDRDYRNASFSIIEIENWAEAIDLFTRMSP